ncbi:DUF1992 domain-containing protein [Nocardioides daphniae]|uniref:DUF1992 domain-containing protein n=1 Tax=Nocardioides daphniae TaxID=402297 RepID=A0A4P7U8E9_9ACTN|nr:DUF1992 domain-containing protein [Nocardioides daphniae]QCC76276.1 DUF1992 domain-containing protein [Nocardioides daphniae]GGD08391.1 hypothetical protein GCM10007231_04050 [Nocardioides daphniae]
MAESPDRRPREPERDERTGRSAAAARIQHQTHWVEQQIRVAQERGDFDDLPGFGKPLEGLGTEHDPDWWVKKLVEREQVTGVLPPALQVRKADAELDGELDRISDEGRVRTAVEEFNASVRRALYTPPVGNAPAFPVVTRQRDVDAEVVRWRERRVARREAQRALLAEQAKQDRAPSAPSPRRWWRRR